MAQITLKYYKDTQEEGQLYTTSKLVLSAQLSGRRTINPDRTYKALYVCSKNQYGISQVVCMYNKEGVEYWDTVSDKRYLVGEKVNPPTMYDRLIVKVTR